jgi:Predicted metal-dependent hydrolase of the TIM-barrel fold
VIIDFHTHVDEAPAFGWLDPPEKIVGLLDEAGIDRAVIMTYTDLPGSNPAALDYITASAKRFPDRLVPFVRLNPSYTDEMPGILKRALQLGVKGVKLHPTTTIAHPAGAATVAVLRLCAEASLPVLFHCGDDPYTTPQALALAAALVPDCSIVMGHMGGYFHAADAIEAAERHENLYLETSAMPYPWLIADAVMRVGASRVIFGSDGPGCNPALELEKIRGLGLAQTDLDLVLSGNAMRLLAESGA